MTFIWWFVWMLSNEPNITTSHWLSLLVLAVAIDIWGASSRAA
jgi:hypothetical protein